MNIRCVNCELEFAYDPPPFASGGTARCPRCGHGNDVAETSATTPAGSMAGQSQEASDAGTGGNADQVFCFNCGKPMQANPQELIPVCSECKAGTASAAGDDGQEAPAAPDPIGAAAPGSAVELMVRKSNGQVYGPFPEETIVEWIRAGKIHPDEEVSKIGGAWKMFSKHDQFSTFFPDVKKTSKPVRQEVQFKKVSAAREAVRSLGKLLVAVTFLCVVGIVVYYLVSRGTLAIPESVIGRASDAIQGAEEGGADAAGDPGRSSEVVGEIRAKYPELEGSAIEHYYRARTAMSRGNVADLLEAVEEMEKAVALDPSPSASLAGLGQVYTLLAHEDDAYSSLLNDSFYFIDLALESREYELEAHKAKAWFLYHTDNLDKAITHVNYAIEVDPGDPEAHVLLGLCNHGKLGKVKPGVAAHFEKALELAPDYDPAHYYLGRCYDADGQHRLALD
ncbi:MAG: tetratricopeptide repeat protein, partial [Myxococcota bacterium]|nr:tetratricopeptide repeat protein [Myxococcota bacterium]